MALGTALAVLSLLGNAVGMAGSSKANKEAESMLTNRENDLQAQLDKAENTNYLDTDQAQSVIKLLGKNFDKQTKTLDNRSAVTGASDEAKVNSKAKAQDSYDTSLTRLAGYGTQYKDMKERNLNSRLDNVFGQKLGVQMGKSENFTNLASNASQVGASGIMTDAVSGGEGGGWLSDLMSMFGKNSSFGKGGIF